MWGKFFNLFYTYINKHILNNMQQQSENLLSHLSCLTTKTFVLLSKIVFFESCRKVRAINVLYNRTTRFKNVNNCLNANIYSYLETYGGQSSNQYLNAVHFFNNSVNQTSVAAQDSCCPALVSNMPCSIASFWFLKRFFVNFF